MFPTHLYISKRERFIYLLLYQPDVLSSCFSVLRANGRQDMSYSFIHFTHITETVQEDPGCAHYNIFSNKSKTKPRDLTPHTDPYCQPTVRPFVF